MCNYTSHAYFYFVQEIFWLGSTTYMLYQVVVDKHVYNAVRIIADGLPSTKLT